MTGLLLLPNTPAQRYWPLASLPSRTQILGIMQPLALMWDDGLLTIDGIKLLGWPLYHASLTVPDYDPETHKLDPSTQWTLDEDTRTATKTEIVIPRTPSEIVAAIRDEAQRRVDDLATSDIDAKLNQISAAVAEIAQALKAQNLLNSPLVDAMLAKFAAIQTIRSRETSLVEQAEAGEIIKPTTPTHWA